MSESFTSAGNRFDRNNLKSNDFFLKPPKLRVRILYTSPNRTQPLDRNYLKRLNYFGNVRLAWKLLSQFHLQFQ